MGLDCTLISDLHGHYPQLEGGDLLIVAGDYTTRSSNDEFLFFYEWMFRQSYKKKVWIAGNHDNLQWGSHTSDKFGCAPRCENFLRVDSDPVYLCDSGTEFTYWPPLENELDKSCMSAAKRILERKKYKIWGSPWVRSFEGMNRHCKAFTCDTEEELDKKWALIPDDVDILITHSPPWGLRDYRELTANEKRKNLQLGFGSTSLAKRIHDIDDKGNGKKRLLICGHIHEGYGVLNISNMLHDHCTWKIVNASHVNERYQPVNKPIRIEI